MKKDRYREEMIHGALRATELKRNELISAFEFETLYAYYLKEIYLIDKDDSNV